MFNHAIAFISWEIMFLLSINFSVIQQGSLMIAMNIMNWCASIGMGYEQAAAALIGSQIGSGNLDQAYQVHSKI